MEEHDDGGGRPAAHGRALEERERLATRELRLAVHDRPLFLLDGLHRKEGR